MPLLEDLIERYRDLPREQLLNRLIELRRSRATKKEISTKPADRPRTKEKAYDETVNLLKGLSERDKAIIAQALLGGNK